MSQSGKTPDELLDEIASLKEELRGYRAAQRDALVESLERPSGAQLDPGHIARILDSSPLGVGISRVDDGFILYQNDTCAEMFGVAPSEPRNARDFWADLSDRQEFVEAFRQGNPLPERPARFVRRDGSEFWAMLTWEPIEVGRQACVLFWVYDVSQLKQQERELRRVKASLEERIATRTAALRRSENHLRSILESLGDCVLVCTESGRIRQKNAAADDLFGGRLADEALLTEALGEDLGARLERAAADAITWSSPKALGDLSVSDATNTVRWLNVVVSPMSPDVGERLAVFVLRDVTEHRHVEAQLRHSARMDSLGRLAGGIAHDFNNLLTAVLGNAQLAVRQATSAQQREHLARVVETTERASDLTQQLLSFARPQAPVRAVTDLNEVLGRFQNTIRRLLEESIELVVQPASPQLPVELDETELNQVLMNLTLNARDSIEGTGMITVRSDYVRLPGEGHPNDLHGDFACLRVKDSGSGIPETILDRIFEPFFSTKGPFDGSGLGLSICYGIVTQHGGRIQVENSPEGGSEFTIYLPISSEPITVEPPDDEPLPRGSETVLIVEDEPNVRELAAGILTEQGYRVVLAESGREALDVFERASGAVDLVLSDVVMPEMGGVALAEHLGGTTPQLPLVLMSGFADRDVPREISGRRVPFLQKPFTLVSLARVVRRALDEA